MSRSRSRKRKTRVQDSNHRLRSFNYDPGFVPYSRYVTQPLFKERSLSARRKSSQQRAGVKKTKARNVQQRLRKHDYDPSRSVLWAPSRSVQVFGPEEVSSVPRRDNLCERRKKRREVLFAFGKTGRGGQKKAIWTPQSLIKCKG